MMPRKNVHRNPGSFVAIQLSDSTYSYGRVRNDGLMSFYDFNTTKLIHDLELIASKPILFSVWVHKSAFKKWEFIGKLSLSEALQKYTKTFRQDIGDPTQCIIVDENGDENKAKPEECIGLERTAVWEDEHVENRILDTINGRPNSWFDMLKVKLP